MPLQPRRHRKRMTVVIAGRAVEVPEAPRGLSAGRQGSWAAYWQSPAGAASASDPNHTDAVYRLWSQYADYDRVTAELAKRPILSPGSMGQDRLSPLAPRQSELLRHIESGERKAGIGGVANQRRQPVEVEVDPAFLLTKMNASVSVPDLDEPEFGGHDPRWGHHPEDMTDDDIARLAAERLRNGEPLSGRPGPSDLYRLLEVIGERGIDQAQLLEHAAERNRENEKLLLAEWERLLAEAKQQLPRIGASTEEETRLQALVSVLEEHLAEAAEHGVMWAQAPPWRKDELASA